MVANHGCWPPPLSAITAFLHLELMLLAILPELRVIYTLILAYSGSCSFGVPISGCHFSQLLMLSILVAVDIILDITFRVAVILDVVDVRILTLPAFTAKLSHAFYLMVPIMHIAF